jgi:hypothetical protein
MALKNLEKVFLDYSHLEKASDYKYFEEVESCVYFWYFPINFKQKGGSLNLIVEDFFEKDLEAYNFINSIELRDNKKKMFAKTGAILPNNSPKLSTEYEDELLNRTFKNFFYYFSTLNKPLYIGKSNRKEVSIGSRIKDHLDLKTDFSKTLNYRLENLNSDIEINDLIIRVLDVEKLRKEKFSKYIGEKFDFALYLESLFITLYKPHYNIKQ